jgi:hypothetical protein
MKPAKEVLDVSIGGFTTMRLEYLRNASREGGSRIPSLWSSNRCFEELQREGLVVEGPETQPGLRRQWLITDAGRTYLFQQQRKET